MKYLQVMLLLIDFYSKTTHRPSMTSEISMSPQAKQICKSLGSILVMELCMNANSDSIGQKLLQFLVDQEHPLGKRLKIFSVN